MSKGDSLSQLHSVAVTEREWPGNRTDGVDLKMAKQLIGRKIQARRQKSQGHLETLV